MYKTALCAAVLWALCFSLSASTTHTVWLSSLDLTRMRQGSGEPQIDKSVKQTPLSIAGKRFTRGVGTHAASHFWVELDGKTDRFVSKVGLNDCKEGTGSVSFRVYADGNKVWDSGLMHTGDEPRTADVPLMGVKSLFLNVDPADHGMSYDHADWVDAHFIVSGAEPRAIDVPREDGAILTPKPGPAPRINGPRRYGCRPGNPFLFRLPATGTRPMQFSAEKLPDGLKLDAATGIIAGAAPKAGEYKIQLTASNNYGKASRNFTIVSGDKLSLTPYMGWNHWYAHENRITDAIMRRAADAMVSSGMADVGYDYVCIDDCWMRSPTHKDPKRGGELRDEKGDMLPNAYFPDMPGLTAYIHSKGLKAGIYTSPGRLTCGGFCGSYQHEAQDAALFARWGFDLLKYDWCSYARIAASHDLEELQKPYRLMGHLLKQQNRDMLFNLCQYGMGSVWQWGSDVGGHSWRTSGDLGCELDRIFPVAAANAANRAWNGPGSWNDPDYLQIGYTAAGDSTKPVLLTPNEQYAFMSMWVLSAAPLMFSGDMEKLDEFTLNVLCNPEVIDIDQDPLGQCALYVPLKTDCFLLVKELEDGSKAVGLCNGGEAETTLSATCSLLGLQGRYSARDPWRQKDLGVREGTYAATVPRHAVALVRFAPKKQTAAPSE